MPPCCGASPPSLDSEVDTGWVLLRDAGETLAPWPLWEACTWCLSPVHTHLESRGWEVSIQQAEEPVGDCGEGLLAA